VRVQERDQLQRHLAEANIGTGIHYPVPLHQQQAYSFLNYKQGDFPVSERAASQILSLPMYPGLTAEHQDRIVGVIANFVSESEWRNAVAAHLEP
jgi:dTDP-4-amino-4,6-dideoxygalactose transaminase